MRQINLTKREETIFKNIKIEEKDIEKLLKKYNIKKVNDVNYITCKIERPNDLKANFMNTGEALVGILQENETLRDFIEYQLRFIKICDRRNEILYKQYKNEKWKGKNTGLNMN